MFSTMSASRWSWRCSCGLRAVCSRCSAQFASRSLAPPSLDPAAVRACKFQHFMCAEFDLNFKMLFNYALLVHRRLRVHNGSVWTYACIFEPVDHAVNGAADDAGHFSPHVRKLYSWTILCDGRLQSTSATDSARCRALSL